MNYMYFDVSRMICAGCSSAIKAKLTQMTGVTDASVDHITGKAIVSYEPQLQNPQAVMAVIEKLGYPTKASEPDSMQSKQPGEQQA